MIMNLRGHGIDWFMKFYIVPPGTSQKNLEEIRVAMIFEFIKPKYESQCITEIKEIKQALAKSVWDSDQQFKTLMAKVSFQILDVNHKEWFISTLLPHIRGPLMQQKIKSHTEALELAMKLEASPIRDGTVGMVQIQSQLANIMIQLQYIKKGKEDHK